MGLQEDFINTIGPMIRQVAMERGYKVASPIIAQSFIESKYGESSLGKKYHNYFGMKCGSGWMGKSVNLSTKEEYTKGTLTNIKANFRVYDSMLEGVRGYFDFINTKRYANLKDAATPQKYLETIRADGYATSFTYVTTNVNCIKQNGLMSYDTRPYKTFDEVVQEVIDGKWGNGEERRARLTDAGFNYAMVQAEVNYRLKGGK